jgi:hypothetical protein
MELQERDDIQASQAQILKLENCQRLTAAQKNELLQEVNAYEKDQRFARKIAEAKGEIELDARFPACLAFLKTKVLLGLGLGLPFLFKARRDSIPNSKRHNVLPRRYLKTFL